MTMLRLSPSAVACYRICKRKYAYEYNEGLRPPSTVKQEFGTEVHRQLELWLREARVPDDTPAGRTAKQGIDKGLLPVPSPTLLIERSFVLPIDVERELEVGGFIDCLCPPDGVDEPLLVDHKTTSSLTWAKEPEALKRDPQALLYGMWAMLRYKVPAARARWIYYAATNPKEGARKPAGCRSVEVRVTLDDPEVLAGIHALLVDLGRMAAIRRGGKPGLSFPASPESCGVYGGCPHLERCNLSPEAVLQSYFERERPL